MGIYGKLNRKPMAVPLEFWPTVSPSEASFSAYLSEFQVPGLQRSQIFSNKTPQMKNKKQQNKLNKLPCFSEIP